MSLSKEKKNQIMRYVDSYVGEYLGLRSQGYASADAISAIRHSYADQVKKDWDNLSLESQIQYWNNLSFGNSADKVCSSEAEERRIVAGLVNAMPLMCPDNKPTLSLCAKFAVDYLFKKYNIAFGIDDFEISKLLERSMD